MRGQFWMARVCLSSSRVFLSPSSGCECENGCVACSHQVAILAVLRHAQDSPSYEQFVHTVKQFTAETLASGAVHWWHLLFPMYGRRSRKKKGAAPAAEGLDGLADHTSEHPFIAAAARAEDERTLHAEAPLFPPGSPEHRNYVCRVLARGHFDCGGASFVVRRDPEWQPALLTAGVRRSVGTQTNPVDDDMADAPDSHLPPPPPPPPPLVLVTMEDAPPTPEASPVRLRTPLRSLIQSIRNAASRSRHETSPAEEPVAVKRSSRRRGLKLD